MGMRKDALWRVVAFLWAIVAGLVAGIVLTVGLFVGLIDIAWQLVLGRDGLSSDSRIMDFIKRVAWWPVNLEVYALTGDGEMQWTP